MRRAFYYIALLALASSCEIVITDPLPPGAVEIDPPASWLARIDALEACSGLTRSGEISWWRVPDGALGRGIVGRWDYPHRIALTEFVATREIMVTIDHEILHDLLGKNNWPEGPVHPPVFDRCHVNI
jgi:hypothetical protein